MNTLTLIRVMLITAAIGLTSCTPSDPDPNGTSTFNKTLVKEYALKRFRDDKILVLIDNVSDTKKIILHGEVLLLSVVSYRAEGILEPESFYFVSKETGNTYLSGNKNLLYNVGENGFDAELATVLSQQKPETGR
jgi:hypothetical protein